MSEPRVVVVWDALLRLLHWSLAASVAAAWLTTWGTTRSHEAAGYVGLAIVLLRIVWGLAGPRYARFTQFVRAPRATLHYLRQLRRGGAPRYVGHNPLGGWMALALWGCMVALALTGWLYTTDRFWGEAWLDVTHQAIAWSMLGLIAAHVVGVLLTGRRQRENLVAAMLSGRKRAAQAGDMS